VKALFNFRSILVPVQLTDLDLASVSVRPVRSADSADLRSTMADGRIPDGCDVSRERFCGLLMGAGMAIWPYVFISSRQPTKVLRAVRTIDGVIHADALFGTPDGTGPLRPA